MAYTEHKTILSTFSKGFVDDVIPHDSSPERREGVRRLSSHIISPRGLTEGEIAVGVWKKGAGADPITGMHSFTILKRHVLQLYSNLQSLPPAAPLD
jgi:hypothetical protein